MQSKYVLISTTETKLPDGRYELELYLAGVPAQRASFTIEPSKSPAVPAPSITDGKVVIKGQVIDAYTRIAISNAMIQVYRSDNMSATGRLLYGTSAVADAFGNFMIFPGVAKGHTYVIEISAPGYKTKFSKDTYTATDPDIIQYNPIELEPWP